MIKATSFVNDLNPNDIIRSLNINENVKIDNVVFHSGERWAHIITETKEKGWCLLYTLEKI